MYVDIDDLLTQTFGTLSEGNMHERWSSDLSPDLASLICHFRSQGEFKSGNYCIEQGRLLTIHQYLGHPF